MARKFIHIDMDCFYAAVEMRDNPAYRNVPIAIGGRSEYRGVVSTCNYIARKYGVRSAMPTAHAKRLCPELVLVPGRMPVYADISKQIRGIFARYTDKIEPLSLDEAYLDVSDSDMMHGSATLIANDIRKAIFNETGLTASAGVAPCKFVAKIASDENKPNGLCVVSPQHLDEFVRELPLGKIPGVGKVTLQKLNHLGLFTCDDVRRYPFDQLVKRFGKFGPVIWDRSHAIDPRSLNLTRERKSVGVERTLSQDIQTPDECLSMIDSLFPKLQERLRKASPSQRIHTQGIKLKFSDFQLTTVEHRFPLLDKHYFQQLLDEAMARRNNRGIRLIGLHVGLPTQRDTEQLSLPFPELESSC
ncbi:DNA polymerase IV [Aestuariibacter salexigens]|uniref:DNA polymerase IV n=1 Tax=Aestuariibacter salexigens TaxID=226010 RepID=UPI000A04252D|nr:DNA polymerase IV [Aestuariibacter salexigens]